MNALILTMALLGPSSGQIQVNGGSFGQTRPAQPGARQPAPPMPVPPSIPNAPPSSVPNLPQADSKNPIDDGGIIVQTRGPLHEAFAQPIDQNPTPATVVPKAPPPPVPELPPGEKPAGANVQWIPGYWGWDPEKNDFLWVSGLWRNMPPDRKWAPGYWNKAGDGWQWTPGYWADAKQNKPQYQPEPPDSLEQGPSQPSPNENYFYIPGAWVYRDGRYVWRPGFWYPAQQDWVYVAPHYNYTPAGAVYLDGYWDYPLADRGTVYAPVVFNQPYWNDPGWYYQPNYAPDFGLGFPFDNFFVGAGRRHFFFGDFFAPNHFRNGFQPWYAFAARNYDPLFSYYHWANRFNPGWFNGLHDNFWAHVNNPALRPPTTLAQTRAWQRVAAWRQARLRRTRLEPPPVRDEATRFSWPPPAGCKGLPLCEPSRNALRRLRVACPRPAGGPSTISSARAISGGSARVFNAGPSVASLSRGAVASSAAINQPIFNANSRAASSSQVSRGPISYQSFYSGPSRTAPTPLYQARARQEEGLVNSQGGQNLLNGNMRQSQAMSNARAYMGMYGGSMGSRSGMSGYSPSMSSFSGRGTGSPGVGGMHVGGGGGGVHAGGGGAHGGGGHR